MRLFQIILVFWIFSLSNCFSQQPATSVGIWNEVAVYNCPSQISGLAFDGHDIFTLGGGSPFPYNGYLNKFNPTDTSFSNLCRIPTEGILYHLSGGLTYQSPWFVSTDQWFNGSWYEPARAIYFDTAGVFRGSSILPRLDTHIIWWDKDHFWGCEPYGNKIYKIDPDGNILKTIGPLTMPFSNLCTQGNFIWVTSPNDTIYKVDANGSTIEKHVSSCGIPYAIVFDGLHLWYSCQNNLVKVEVFGAGFPDFENRSADILHIYPNPSSGKITIDNTDNGYLSILTINGSELIYRETTKPIAIIDVTSLSAGVYFIKTVDEKGVRMGKFIRP